jgi:hypothetical protein
MENESNKIYFSHQALARFVSAQGKTVSKIVCHLWQNSIKENDVFEIIDNVELHFTDDQKLTISCNDNGDGLDAIDFNAKETAKALKTEFSGKIKLFQVDASTTKMWQDVIGLALQSVQLTKDGEHYVADSLMLNFGEEKRTISISPTDGLIIDYYEEN